MFIQNRACSLIAFLTLLLVSSYASAQYVVTDLVTNTGDPELVNAWGISYLPGGPFWVSDNGTGLSTLYDAAGTKQSLVVTIPRGSGGGKGSPTGQVANTTSQFVVSQNGKSGPASFLFATFDGTISGWSPAVNASTAVIAVNKSGTVSYTGLTLAKIGTVNLLYAADNLNNKIDVYDGTFTLRGSFTDPGLPAGSAAYNVQNIKGFIVVAFTTRAVGGVVDVFTTSGKLVKTFASGGTLNAPWGIALAPANFGAMSNAVLIGNLGDGRINAFSTSGTFLGQLKDTTGTVISIDGLWGLIFGGGTTTNGQTNQLFFTA